MILFFSTLIYLPRSAKSKQIPNMLLGTVFDVFLSFFLSARHRDNVTLLISPTWSFIACHHGHSPPIFKINKYINTELKLPLDDTVAVSLMKYHTTLLLLLVSILGHTRHTLSLHLTSVQMNGRADNKNDALRIKILIATCNSKWNPPN